MAENTRKDVAQAQFARLQKGDGKQAVAGYEAEAAALRAKTEKLRALRLARDAELAASRPAAAAAPKRGAKKQAARKPAAGNLADWIKAREDGGHNN